MPQQNEQRVSDPQKPPKNKSWYWLLVKPVILGSLLVIFFIVAGIAFKNYLIFHPISTYLGDPSQFTTDYQTVWLTTEAGEKLKAWYIPAPQPGPTKTILFFQGNAGNMSYMLDRLAILHSLGLNIMTVDYPGYGDSSGSPSEGGTYQAAEETWQWVTQNKSSPNDIIIYGFSLGGGVATWLAKQHPPNALILDSTFTRLRAVPQTILPLLKPYFHITLGDAYNTKSRLKYLNCTLLILHSPDDKIVPITLGQQLYNSYQGNQKNMAIGHGGHMDFASCYYSNENNSYKKHLKKLLQPQAP